MKLTTPAPGDDWDSGLVMPRAIKTAGTTTAAAPYSADQNTSNRPVTAQATKATATPTTS